MRDFRKMRPWLWCTDGAAALARVEVGNTSANPTSMTTKPGCSPSFSFSDFAGSSVSCEKADKTSAILMPSLVRPCSPQHREALNNQSNLTGSKAANQHAPIPVNTSRQHWSQQPYRALTKRRKRRKRRFSRMAGKKTMYKSKSWKCRPRTTPTPNPCSTMSRFPCLRVLALGSLTFLRDKVDGILLP